MLLRLLIAVVALAPLALGAAPNWAWTSLGAVVGLLLLSWGTAAAVSGNGLAVPLARLRIPLVLFILAVLWILAQMAAGPPDGWAHPLWRSTAQLLGSTVPGHISLAPFNGGSMLLRLLTYAGIFWIALQSCRVAKDANAVFLAVAVAGTAYALYGLAVDFSGAQTILWLEKERYLDSVTSTFRYKNAYAGYAGLGLVCVIGLLLKGLETLTDRQTGKQETLRRVALWVAERGWMYATAAIVILTALILSGSRAGLLCAAAGLVVLMLCARATHGPPMPYLGTATLVLGLGFIGSVLLSGDTVLDSIASIDVENDARRMIYEATSRAISDAAWLGTGAGSYAEAFALYHPPTLLTRPDYAHSGYLENALELGIPAAVALTLALAAPAFICLLGVRRRRRNALFPCIGVAASVMVGLHATIDFAIQVPAVAATYALVMGAACAQSWRTRNGDP